RDLFGHPLPRALTDGGDVGGHLGAERTEGIALEDEAGPGPVDERLSIVRWIALALAVAREPRVARELDAVAAEHDRVREHPHIDGLAEMPGRHRVLIAVDPHEALAVHARDSVKPVRRGGRPQRPEGGPLGGKSIVRP